MVRTIADGSTLMEGEAAVPVTLAVTSPRPWLTTMSRFMRPLAGLYSPATATLMTRLVYRRSRVVTMPLAIWYVPVIESNSSREAKSDGGTSARSRDEIAPPTLTTPPMRASASRLASGHASTTCVIVGLPKSMVPTAFGAPSVPPSVSVPRMGALTEVAGPAAAATSSAMSLPSTVTRALTGASARLRASFATRRPSAIFTARSPGFTRASPSKRSVGPAVSVRSRSSTRYRVSAPPPPRATYVTAPFSILTRAARPAAPAPPPTAPPAPRPGRARDSAVPRLATFSWPSGFWMSAMTGRSSVRSPNSTRPPSRGRTRSASRPVSSLRNGAVPNCGSSPTSSPCSSTAGRGKTTTETDANFTGRPSACDALDAISACTRGVSTTNGTATIAAIATTTTTTRTPTVHQRARITEERRGRLRRLDRRQTPGVGSDRARERPVLLDVLPRPRAVHNAPARVVHRVVDERDGEVHRDPVLPALLPRLRHLGAVDPNLLDPVRLPRAAQAVTLGLEARVLLRGQAIGEGAHVPTAARRLDVGERRPGPARERVGFEAPIHLLDVLDATVPVGRLRRNRHGHGAAA